MRASHKRADSPKACASQGRGGSATVCRTLPLMARVRLESSASLLALLLIAGWMAEPLIGQTIRGVVIERTTDRPIDLARVVLVEAGGDTVAVTASDARGFFSVTTDEPGDYRVTVEAFGYRLQGAGPFELARGELRVVQINLDASPVEIRGLDVETEETASPYLVRQGFTERRRMGFGRFLGPRDLEDFRTIIRSTQDIFYRVPGVMLGPTGPYMIGSNGIPCGPTIFLDGIRVEAGVPPLEHLEAIEIYARAVQVPLQYALAAEGCGVILYWTKH